MPKTMEPEQKELPGVEKPQDAPITIKGDKLLAKYVRPHYYKDEKDRYFVGLEFSFPLTNQHKGFLPEDVEYSWKILKSGRSGRKIVNIEVGPQAVNIYFAPDDGATLSMLYCDVTDATLAIIEETGSGKAQDVIRYSFRITHPSDGDANSGLRDFADLHFDKMIWLRMGAVQSSLIKRHLAEEETEKD